MSAGQPEGAERGREARLWGLDRWGAVEATMPYMPGNQNDFSEPGIGPEEAHDRVDQGALLLDVREDFEWAAGHAPAAQHVPLGQLPERMDELDRQRQFVVVCRAGTRSSRATAFLVGNGFDAVNLDGGMQAWADAGLEVAGLDGSPGIIA